MAKGKKVEIKETPKAKPTENVQVRPEPTQLEVVTAVINKDSEMYRVRIINPLMRKYRLPGAVGSIVSYPKKLVEKAIANGDAELVK